MKIYGKTLPEIYKQLLWTQKTIVCAGALFLAFSALYIPYFLFTFGLVREEAGPLVISGTDTLVGNIDPSIASDGSMIYMAYTGVTPATGPNTSLGMEIQIATGNRKCLSWSKATTALPTKEEELVAADGLTPLATGVWRNETASIVYDPQDPEAPWKLFAYKYFWSGKENLSKKYSVIVWSTSTEPADKWNREEWLFATNAALPPMPYNSFAAKRLSDLDSSLANVAFYSRPSVVEANGVLLMSLSAFIEDRESVDRVILIASFNHGKSWKYLGTLLDHEKAVKSGLYTKISGATLIRQKDIIYLAAVFGDTISDSAGTFIIPFKDIMKGKIQEQADGTPLVMKKIPQSAVKPSKIGGGFAAYNDACEIGLVTSEYSELNNNYRLFKTYKLP